MTKDESLMLKGVAILLMLFLHLFNNLEVAESCSNFIVIGNVPLVHILTRAANPVAFYIILSGYGLYVVQHKRHYDVVGKLKKLYVHYWVSLLVFIPIGAAMCGMDRYPRSFVDVVANMTGYHTTWNATIWFLLPYALLALASKRIWTVLDATRPWLYIGGTFCIALICSFLISRYGALFLYDNCWAYIPVLFFQMLFPFSLGAYLAKYPSLMALKLVRGGGNFLLLIIVIALRCCISSGVFHTFYVLAFIILFVSAPKSERVKRFLLAMGRRSTSIWFVHAYFYSMLFHDFIYSFRYPLLIYVVLLCASYVSAVVVDAVNSFALKYIFR